MKKHTLKIAVSMLLAIIMMLSSAALIGCDKNVTPSDDQTAQTTVTADTTEQTTDTESDTNESQDTESEITDTEDTESSDSEVEETTKPEETTKSEETTEIEPPVIEPAELTVFTSGATDFTIVVPNGASSAVYKSANDLAKAFDSKVGVKIEVLSELEYKEDNDGAVDGAKIVIGGVVGDDLDADLKKSLRPGEYLITAAGESVYFLGSTDAEISAAVTYFITKYLKGSLLTVALGDVYKNDLSGRVAIPDMTISGNEIWRYKIVYTDTYYAKRCASTVQLAIFDSTGYTLDMVSDATAESKYEILVGKTNRAESASVRSRYARPNVYYEITAVGDKAVFMAEGYSTLVKLTTEFNWYMINNSNTLDIKGTVLNGDILNAVDTRDKNVIVKADGTDLRVLHWNMAAPYLNDANKVYTDNAVRGEIMADMILQFLPDIITTNEFYHGHASNKLYGAVMKELSEFYNILDKSPYEIGKPNPDSKPKNQFKLGPTIHENILYKKDLGFKVKWSGWRYNYENVYYHGYHTAVFERPNGQPLIVSVGHYADSTTNTVCPEEHLAAINDAIAASGVSAATPTIITGDMYTWNNNSNGAYAAGYNFWVQNGYTDSQVSAPINGNNTPHYGTFHTIGVEEGSRAGEDFIWHKNGFSALCYKVLVNQLSTDTSDHYPVMADLKFI